MREYMAKQLEFLKADGLLDSVRDYEVVEGIEHIGGAYEGLADKVAVAAE